MSAGRGKEELMDANNIEIEPKYQIMGLSHDECGESEIFVAEGHDVPFEAIRDYARNEEDHREEDHGKLSPPQNVWGVWKEHEDFLGIEFHDEFVEGALPVTRCTVLDEIPSDPSYQEGRG